MLAFLTLLQGLPAKILGALLALIILTFTHYGIYWKGRWDEQEIWLTEKAVIEQRAAAAAAILRAENKALQAKLTEATARVEIQYVEIVKVIKEKASPTRVCLRRNITDELNRNRDGWIREKVERPDQPPTIKEHQPPAGAISEEGTSEQAMSLWAVDTAKKLDQCRINLATWIDWYKNLTTQYGEAK